MYLILNTYILRRIIIVVFFIMAASVVSVFAQNTIIQGMVKDADTGEPVEYAFVQINNTTLGTQTDSDGYFKLVSQRRKNRLMVSQLGYETWSGDITPGTTTMLEISLKPSAITLDEVVVMPGNDKYSKKNNPAIELIKKVIANKNKYNTESQAYYDTKEYESMIFALNEFDPQKTQYKGLDFLEPYAGTSRIDGKTMLPFSIRETVSSYYYRKDPHATKRIIEGYKMDGLDKNMNVDAIDAFVKELIKDVDITDNNINILLRDFVGPLNSLMSTNFYRWYIIDTVHIDNKPYVNLGFVPFNTRDAGFIGNIFVSTDSTYSVKQIKMRIPKNANVNHVEEMVIEQHFEEVAPGVWGMTESIFAMDLSLVGAVKVYVEKVKNMSDYAINMPVDIVFLNPAPEVYIADYKKRTDNFWTSSRPALMYQSYDVDSVLNAMLSKKFLRITWNVINLFAKSYIPVSGDPETNKFEVGTPLTFFSFNGVEGARLRLTGMTNTNFSKHFFLYGYAAYGFADKKPKYMIEGTWSLRKRQKHKEEYPVSSFSIIHKYDLNSVGQKSLQLERDNIFLSGRNARVNNTTYASMTEVAFRHEFYNNFSFRLLSNYFDEKPAGNLEFRKMDESGDIYTVPYMRTSEIGVDLRFAPGEKFFIQSRKRRRIPSPVGVFELAYRKGLKGVWGSEYDYHKASLTVSREFWIAPFGKLKMRAAGEKVWGTAPFTSLLTHSANTSIAIQDGEFGLLEPMEFLNDQHVLWDVDYRMGGWLFNRVPLIKYLNLREIFGFRGYWGSLSRGNNPEYNRDLLLLPNQVYPMRGYPYMEINVGIENILGLFRVDYVRRLNYLDHPNTNKHGFKIGLALTF